MKALLQWFWAREPILVSLAGAATVWGAIFGVLAAFGHPLTPTQQTALLALLGAISGVVGRTQVTPNSGATAQTVDLQKVGKP